MPNVGEIRKGMEIGRKGYKAGYTKGLIGGRLNQIEELKREIKLLQWQIKQLIGVEE